jgi:hypothetical protein
MKSKIPCWLKGADTEIAQAILTRPDSYWVGSIDSGDWELLSKEDFLGWRLCAAFDQGVFLAKEGAFISVPWEYAGRDEYPVVPEEYLEGIRKACRAAQAVAQPGIQLTLF